MTWLRRYTIRHYLTNSIWILPSLSILLALAIVPLLHALERRLGSQSGIDPEAARTVLGMMASAMFTFIVFVCSALLIAVQLASAQLTPRIIALVFRDPVTKYSLTLFVFTFTFTLAALVRINSDVPMLTARLSAYGCLACVVVFLLLIDHVGKWLRPSGALRAVALSGLGIIEHVYPRRFTEGREARQDSSATLDPESAHTVLSLRNGVVLAFDIRGLVIMAQRADCLVELVPQVGDFVASGDPLFRVYRDGASLSDERLRQSVAVGQERTMEQDPALAFRIIVDVAAKGLSPAINDPTTAVLAIDQIHHLLRNIGGRNLDDERVRDAAGRTRLVFRTPSWEDFVQLAVTEVRHFGGESIQIARRLRAMLENLIQTLPPERAAFLRPELSLLQRSAARFFPEPEDQAMAKIGDLQGMGGQWRQDPDDRN